MLHGLWLILKIIGIIVLILIGLLLLLLLAVLFVPLRYRGKGSYFGEPQGFLKVSWLLHILSIRLQYEKEMTAVIRIFGYPVMKQTLFGENETDEFEAEVPERIADAVGEVLNQGADVAGEAGEYGGEMPAASERPEPLKDRKAERTDEKTAAEAKELTEPSSKKIPETSSGKTKKISETSSGKISAAVSGHNENNTAETSRWKLFLNKIKDCIISPFRKLKFSFQRICAKMKELTEKKDRFLKFWNDEVNKKTFSLVIGQCKRLIKHIRPQKVKGRIAFGFDDPYTTGQVLMYAGPLLGWYHKWLNLEPYFDRQVLEGEIAFKGRIRAAAVLMIGFKVYRDRNFRKLLKAFQERV